MMMILLFDLAVKEWSNDAQRRCLRLLWLGRHWLGRLWLGRHWLGRHWLGRLCLVPSVV
jgi:hypothetical protein